MITTHRLVLVALGAAAFSCGGDAPPAPVPPPTAKLAIAPAAPAPALPGKPAYPPTRKEDVVDDYGGGLVVRDPYRWLESGESPEVKHWSEAENAFARKVLDALPARDAIGARIEQLLGESSPAWTDLQKRGARYFALERKPPKQHPFLVVRSSLDTGDERVLVDPNVLDPAGGTNLEWFVPSFDGSKVAASLSTGGGEHGDVHVFDVASGKELGDVVPQADGGGSGECLAWKKDGSGFFYTRGAAEADKPKDAPGVYQQVWFHHLGMPVTTDVMSVGKGSPAIAQWELVASDDGRWVVARMQYGDGGEFDQWLLGTAGSWKEVAPRAERVKRMVVGAGDALYLLSTRDGSGGEILLTSLSHPNPAGDGWQMHGGVVTDLVATRTKLVFIQLVDGPSRITSIDLPRPPKPGSVVHQVRAPVIGGAAPRFAMGGLLALGGDEVAYRAVSYTEPAAWYRRTEEATVKTALAETSSADFSGITVDREQCTSKDGTEVPLTILSPREPKPAPPRDGTTPTVLYGYGGFGISMTPRFRPELLAWLEQGGAFAVANLRGGGERGEDWHRGGNFTHKQNVFDDFYACAQHLFETKRTSPAHLAIRGGSNGGLLMGAELAQHPEAWKAVVSQVGIYDMLRVERDANGVFNAAEYGTVKEPAQRDALAAYSPYHHVKAGVDYPASLFLTGANDPRVNPYHSRKMVARLQDATSSAAPILLRTSANTGHGMGSPLHAIIEETIDIDAFLFRELGMHYHPR